MMLVRTNYSKPGSAVRTTSDRDSDLNLAASNFGSLGDSEVLESCVTSIQNRVLCVLLLSLSGLLLANVFRARASPRPRSKPAHKIGLLRDSQIVSDRVDVAGPQERSGVLSLGVQRQNSEYKRNRKSLRNVIDGSAEGEINSASETGAIRRRGAMIYEEATGEAYCAQA